MTFRTGRNGRDRRFQESPGIRRGSDPSPPADAPGRLTAGPSDDESAWFAGPESASPAPEPEPLDPESLHDAGLVDDWDEQREWVNVVDVELSPLSQPIPFDAGDWVLLPGDRVVAATPRGIEQATVVRASRFEPRRGADLPKVLRRSGPGDDRQDRRNLERAADAETYARRRIEELRLPMKLLAVEILHGGSRAVVHFESESRIDFRSLVRDLVDRLRLRVEMRQLGVRDSARLVGALGRCGQQACCCRHLRAFGPVSIRMAKDQNLVLSPDKVSGVCGRLLCCLSYEHECYRALRTGLPKIGRRIATPEGEGFVKDVDVLRRRVAVELAGGDRRLFTAEELVPPAAAPSDDSVPDEASESDSTIPPDVAALDDSIAGRDVPREPDGPDVDATDGGGDDDGTPDAPAGATPESRRRRRNRRGRRRRPGESPGGDAGAGPAGGTPPPPGTP